MFRKHYGHLKMLAWKLVSEALSQKNTFIKTDFYFSLQLRSIWLSTWIIMALPIHKHQRWHNNTIKLYFLILTLIPIPTPWVSASTETHPVSFSLKTTTFFLLKHFTVKNFFLHKITFHSKLQYIIMYT